MPSQHVNPLREEIDDLKFQIKLRRDHLCTLQSHLEGIGRLMKSSEDAEEVRLLKSMASFASDRCNEELAEIIQLEARLAELEFALLTQRNR